LQVDPEYLRQHYERLSDEALLEVDREDLVDVAQKCYDEEVSRRGLDVRTGKARVAREHVISSQSDALGDDEEAVDEESVDDAAEAGDQPGWLEEAACVLSYNVHPGQHLAPECENARDVLQAAGIPCYLELHEIEQSSAPEPTHDWRVLVPGKLNLRATSVLEEEIFNPEIEAQWRAHLQELSDDELRAVTPRQAYGGLFDRLERVTRAYEDEMARRGLKPESR